MTEVNRVTEFDFCSCASSENTILRSSFCLTSTPSSEYPQSFSCYWKLFFPARKQIKCVTDSTLFLPHISSCLSPFFPCQSASVLWRVRVTQAADFIVTCHSKSRFTSSFPSSLFISLCYTPLLLSVLPPA